LRGARYALGERGVGAGARRLACALARLRARGARDARGRARVGGAEGGGLYLNLLLRALHDLLRVEPLRLGVVVARLGVTLHCAHAPDARDAECEGERQGEGRREGEKARGREDERECA
jgi:hypothetical protein